MEKRIYKVAEIEETRKEAEELLSRSLDDEIKERMKAVIEAEAPIRKALLYKRVLNSFGLQKVGSRLLSLFEELSLTLPFPTTLDGDGEVVFHKEEKGRGIHVACSCTHHRSVIWHHAHGCVNTYSFLHGAYRNAISNVTDDDSLLVGIET